MPCGVTTHDMSPVCVACVVSLEAKRDKTRPDHAGTCDLANAMPCDADGGRGTNKHEINSIKSCFFVSYTHSGVFIDWNNPARSPSFPIGS